MLRVHRLQRERCVSYLCFDSNAREALLIDPKLELMQDYRTCIADEALKLKVVVDLRLHCHHYSATHLLAAEYGCEIAMSHLTQSQRATQRLGSGDQLRLGNLSFQVLESPGAASDGICLLGEGLVFTGDTLWLGVMARADFESSDIRALWKSQKVLSQLPSETLVYAGHEFGDLLFSTVVVERAKNPDLLSHWDEFVASHNLSRLPATDEETRKKTAYNCSKNPLIEPSVTFTEAEQNPYRFNDPTLTTLSVEKFEQRINAKKEGHIFLDIREKREFDCGHIPGTINIPVSEIGFQLGNLRTYQKIFLSCQGGGRSPQLSKNLAYLEFPSVITLQGGIQAWMNAGFPVEK